MPNWVTRLNDLKHWFEMQPSILDRATGRKLFAEFESMMHEELRNPEKQESGNYVAMTPAPFGILQRPDPICTHCGLVMQVRHTGGLTYVIDHGPDSASNCPNAFKMWKVKAATLPFQEEVFVPPFVREAMGKNS